jgi:cell wall-associated NlpC family hydrolase
VARWERRARARVGRLFVEVREAPGRGPLISPLFWNGRVIALGTRGRFRQVELPDGRRGWAPAGALVSGRATNGLAKRVAGLLGIPYLWGGRTPLGFDCSGFTQQVLAEQGVTIARDAEQQFRRARPLRGGEKPRIGDLLFFGPPGGPMGHVGLGLGGGYYAHCRKHVRINSDDPSNPLYDNELKHQLRGWRRPIGRA